MVNLPSRKKLSGHVHDASTRAKDSDESKGTVDGDNTNSMITGADVEQRREVPARLETDVIAAVLESASNFFGR